MNAFSAKVVQHSINQLIINTINDAEKMLLNIPRDGDRVEVITSSSHDHVVKQSDSKPYRTTADVVADKVTSTSTKLSELSTSNVESSSYTPTSLADSQQNVSENGSNPSPIRQAIKKLPADKAEIVPGSVQVSPLRQMEGVMIELMVTIKMKSGGSKTVNMQIECPRFQPKRIRMDGVWHNIV